MSNRDYSPQRFEGEIQAAVNAILNRQRAVVTEAEAQLMGAETDLQEAVERLRVKTSAENRVNWEQCDTSRRTCEAVLDAARYKLKELEGHLASADAQEKIQRLGELTSQLVVSNFTQTLTAERDAVREAAAALTRAAKGLHQAAERHQVLKREAKDLATELMLPAPTIYIDAESLAGDAALDGVEAEGWSVWHFRDRIGMGKVVSHRHARRQQEAQERGRQEAAAARQAKQAEQAQELAGLEPWEQEQQRGQLVY